MSNKKQDSIKDPRTIHIEDRQSFAQWCASMYLNAPQAGAVLNISPQMIYKYINPESQKSATPRGPIRHLCELIGKMNPDARRIWVKEKIKEAGIPSPWPAENPISVK